MARSDGKSTFLYGVIFHISRRDLRISVLERLDLLCQNAVSVVLGLRITGETFLSQGERSPTERSALSSVHGQYVAVGGEICSETRDAPTIQPILLVKYKYLVQYRQYHTANIVLNILVKII